MKIPYLETWGNVEGRRNWKVNNNSWKSCHLNPGQLFHSDVMRYGQHRPTRKGGFSPSGLLRAFRRLMGSVGCMSTRTTRGPQMYQTQDFAFWRTHRTSSVHGSLGKGYPVWVILIWIHWGAFKPTYSWTSNQINEAVILMVGRALAFFRRSPGASNAQTVLTTNRWGGLGLQ